MGELLRAALQRRFAQMNGNATSPVLSERDGDERRLDQHRHAHFFSSPDRGGERIDHLAVWGCVTCA